MKALVWALLGMTLGTVPGLVLLGLTVPVSGEAELTLGVAGLVGLLVGAVTGAAVAIATYRGRIRRLDEPPGSDDRA